MTASKIFTPPVRLAKLVRTPGGLPVAEALEAANAGLSGMRQAALDDTRATLSGAQAFLAKFESPNPEQIGELYLIVSRPIGIASVCGLPGIDKVLLSSANLLDIMKMHVRWNREPVELHINSLALLLSNPDLSLNPDSPLVVGLQKVVDRYSAQLSSAEPPIGD